MSSHPQLLQVFENVGIHSKQMDVYYQKSTLLSLSIKIVKIKVIVTSSCNGLLQLTLQELMGSNDIKFASSEEAQHQRVWLVPETLQHQFGQVVSLGCPLPHHGPQILQRRCPSLVCLTQLILCLEEKREDR